MANVNEKILAVTQLMQNGILTTDELSKIIQVLSDLNNTPSPTKSPLEQKYEDFMKNNVANAFKSPSSVKFPPLQSSMIKEGELKISKGFGSKKQYLRYIETYIDAPNAYGTMLREQIAIVIDEQSNFTMVLQALKNPFTGNSLGQWMIMPGVTV